MSSMPGKSAAGTHTHRRVRSPCEVLRNDYMLPRSMSPTGLACRAALPVERIQGIIMGERIDPECAIRLAFVFRTTALFWLVLQAEFDMELVRRRHGPGGLGEL